MLPFLNSGQSGVSRQRQGNVEEEAVGWVGADEGLECMGGKEDYCKPGIFENSVNKTHRFLG